MSPENLDETKPSRYPTQKERIPRRHATGGGGKRRELGARVGGGRRS
jgi:hypothetical protein